MSSGLSTICGASTKTKSALDFNPFRMEPIRERKVCMGPQHAEGPQQDLSAASEILAYSCIPRRKEAVNLSVLREAVQSQQSRLACAC